MSYDWETVCDQELYIDSLTTLTQLSFDFLFKYKNIIDWKFISKHYKFSRNELQQIEEYIVWPLFSENKHLTNDDIHFYKDKLDFNILCKRKDLHDMLLNEFGDLVLPHWNTFLMFAGSLSMTHINNNLPHTDICVLLCHRMLPEYFIRKLINTIPKIDFSLILKHQEVTKSFILENASRFTINEWLIISKNKCLTKLNSDDLLPYADKLDWRIVIEAYNLSPNIVRHVFNNIKQYKLSNHELVRLLEKANLSCETFVEYWNVIDPERCSTKYCEIVSLKYPVDIEFIEKYKKEIRFYNLAKNPYLTPKIINKYYDEFDELEKTYGYNVIDKFGVRKPKSKFSLLFSSCL